MSWYWKEIEDKDSAADATKAAVGISYFIAVVTGLMAVLTLVYSKPILGLSGWALVDAGLFAVIGWRIGRLSRAWAVVGLALYLLEVLDSIGRHGFGFSVVSIAFIIAYVNGLRGVFAYHKYVKQEAAQPLPSASSG
jgi:hypothetical protein